MAFPLGDNQDLESLVKRLDRGFAEHIASLTSEERLAIITWQSMDRAYERIQKAAATATGSRQDRFLIKQLINAAQRGSLPEELVVWRGIRDSSTAFNLRPSQLDQLFNHEITANRFWAGSIDFSVAVRFTKPPHGSGPAIIRIVVPIGVPAIWVAGAGSADLALKQQLEILLPLGTRLKYGRVDWTRNFPILNVRVVSDA